MTCIIRSSIISRKSIDAMAWSVRSSTRKPFPCVIAPLCSSMGLK